MQNLRKPAPEAVKNRKHFYIATGLFVAITLGIVALPYLRTDPQVAKVQALRDQMAGQTAAKLTDTQKKELWGQFRSEIEKLTPEQRRMVFTQGREAMQKQFEARIDQYFTLGPKERVAYLDQMINQMEAKAKQWQAKAPAAKPAGFGPGGGGPRAGKGKGPVSAEERDRARRNRLDRSTPEQRAKRTEFFRALELRRQQRGLPASAFGRPRT